MFLQKLFSLNGKVTIVTGAAGQLGSEMCKALCQAGSLVVIADLDGVKAEDLAKVLQERGSKCYNIQVDITSKKSVQTLLNKALNEFGKIDVLINNAGVACFTPFEKRTLKEFEKVIDANVKGTFLCSQIIGKQMIKQKYGNIINIASIYGMVGADQRIYADSGRNSSEVYAFSKGGIINFTRYLAVYLAPYNIRVNCISPGGIFNNQDSEFVKNYSYKTPLGRMGKDTELNGAIIFLASDASSYVTGHNLVVDGGWTAW